MDEIARAAKAHWQDCACPFCASDGERELRKLAKNRDEAEHDLTAYLIDLDLSPWVSPMGCVAYDYTYSDMSTCLSAALFRHYPRGQTGSRT